MMPVGINFENTLLKNSFSLSSLQPTSNEVTPDKGVKPRQFNSLTKTRVKATAVRRSWGSTASDQREEFWSVLQANYNYIMDNQLIDKCQEVNGDLPIQTGIWTLKEFYAQFSELYSWLNSVQETIYEKEENITDKALRARCVNKVLEKSSSLQLFNDQASQLVQLYPQIQEEVGWRTTHLNSKWDSILIILGPSGDETSDQDTCLDIDNELKCLRTWFRMMESCLQPLDFRAKYTKTEIETKSLELNVLHRDIENHGKIVGSVVKLCKKPDAKCTTANVRRIANGLERRWHLLFLRSLEWQCYIESLSKKQNLKNSTNSSEDTESDYYKEPASKYPRLSNKDYRFKSQNYQPEETSSEDDDCLMETCDNVMTDKNSNDETNIVDSVDGAISIDPDTSQFTQSNKKGPNLATYYFKHEDTDSDMDKVNNFAVIKTDGQTSTLDDTSEEEWTFTKTDNNKSENIMDMTSDDKNENSVENIPKSKFMSGDELRMLVRKAEELVSPDKSRKLERSNPLKMSRVNRWLCIEKPDDSCDASGEDDEKESETSEDIDASTVTLKESRNNSFYELSKNKTWCRSCMSTSKNSGMNNFSISESALHKMNLSPRNLDRQSAHSANNFNVNGSNSTSSTVEEISHMVNEKNSCMRKKKSKLKKKALFGKSDPHLLYSPNCSKRNRNLLMKSGSFSEYTLQKSNDENRSSSSDPSVVSFCPHLIGENSTTSGAESDEQTRKWTSSCKLVTKQRYPHTSEIRDNSPGKSSLNATESSSLSEAWDNYQENYLSEPYSESHDSDAARKLLNFGEDYRNFFDSQSDWSVFSDVSPKFKRKILAPIQRAEDSNSEDDGMKQFINKSQEQLQFAQNIFGQMKDGIDLVTDQLEDLGANCDHHITMLNHLTGSTDTYNLSSSTKAITTGLMNQWNNLKLRNMKLQEYKRLKQEIDDFKKFIKSLEATEKYCELRGLVVGSNPSEDIKNEIEDRKRTLELINNQSTKLASLNAVVHRFTLEQQDFDDFSKCTLKSEVSELYELFDMIKNRTTESLNEIENLLPEWKKLENSLEQLQKDLLEDGKAMHFLDSVLTNGQLTNQTATSVRGIAKLLSETTSHQGYPLELFTEGSFSDSGISDEGSEHDIGERQGRLASIRRLVRKLEIGLSPDCKVRLIMREKLAATEEELRAMQVRCQNLIVKTAACSHPMLEKLSQKDKPVGEKPSKPNGGDDDDPSNKTSEKNRWFKRLFKTSTFFLTFQIVIITFVCLSFFYEPRCCDYMNNYSWSVSPKLHYEGRPPI